MFINYKWGDEIRSQYLEIIRDIFYRFDENIDTLTAVDACDPKYSNFMDVIGKSNCFANVCLQDNVCMTGKIGLQLVFVQNIYEKLKILESNKLTIMKPFFQEINKI